ncbi:MAG TPA: aminoglycoside 6-adenylyltransferase [Anaerolineae bacterium]|nr:aminoglycoside 6-adenylyltransferase [Anaerolineae bacterium]
MQSEPLWHETAIARLSAYFSQDPTVRAVLLAGSLADDAVQADFWSDVDLKVILSDDAVDRYHAATDWLASFGCVVGLERHTAPLTKTLRVCLADFRRFDFVFIPESALRAESFFLHPPCRVLWSKLPDLEARIVPSPLVAEPPHVSVSDIERIADAFCFKAAVAITKVARNDWLIGMHLALDLARDCLVLQMLRRDREMGTTIHRSGGWGNDLVAQLIVDEGKPSAQKILDLIQWSCKTFDVLAAGLAPDYIPRAAYGFFALDDDKIIPFSEEL